MDMTLRRMTAGNWEHCIRQLGGKPFADGREIMRDIIEGYERNELNDRHVQRGTWLPESTNVVDGRILLARAPFNVLIPHAEIATKLHSLGYEEFYLGNHIRLLGQSAVDVLKDVAREDAGKPVPERRVFISPVESFKVDWDRFGDNDTIVWYAQSNELAKEYGGFLHNNFGVNSVNVYLPKIKRFDFARGNWLCRIGKNGDEDRSGFYLDSWAFGNSDTLAYQGSASSSFRVPDFQRVKNNTLGYNLTLLSRKVFHQSSQRGDNRMGTKRNFFGEIAE